MPSTESLGFTGAIGGASTGAAIGSIIPGIGTGIGALVGGGLGLVGDLVNWGSQSEQKDYDRALQQQIFAREDTAVQRRAADLEAAGLSKTLAAGSAAGAGSVVKSQAPQFTANNARAGAQLAIEIAQTKSQLKVNEAQAKNLESVAALNRANAEKVKWENLEMNPQRLRQIMSEINYRDLQSEATRLANNLAQINISNAKLNNQLLRITKRIQEATGLEYAQAQIAALAAQTKLYGIQQEKAGQETNRLIEDNKFYRLLGLPTNMGWNMMTSVFGLGVGIAEKIAKLIEEQTRLNTEMPMGSSHEQMPLGSSH